MILTKFKARSIKQILKAHISNSDKVQNLREAVKPFGLQDDLKNVYTPQQALDNLNLADYKVKNSKSSALDTVKQMAKADKRPLASKHYLIATKGHELHEPTDDDVKGIDKQVLKLLRHSEE